jgi:hypothetical protein
VSQLRRVVVDLQSKSESPKAMLGGLGSQHQRDGLVLQRSSPISPDYNGAGRRALWCRVFPPPSPLLNAAVSLIKAPLESESVKFEWGTIAELLLKNQRLRVPYCMRTIAFIERAAGLQRPSERNLNMLRAMCFVARGLNADIPRVLGVATTGANQAYDFCFLNKKTWSPQNEAIMRKVQKEYGIFASPRRTEAGEDEYPPPSS